MELSASDDRCRRAAADAAKLAEDLRHEQEHSLQLERYKKQLESQVKVEFFGLQKPRSAHQC